MTRRSKFAAMLAAALLAAGLAACGGEEDSTTETQSEARTDSDAKEGGERSDGSKAADGKDSGKSKSGGDEKGSSSDSERGKDIGNFVPKQHSDSGGGAEQFRVKGGDNSVQEFGGEAADSDFEEVSTALHNFLDARAVGDWTAACSYLTSSVVESLEKLSQRSEQGAGMDCGEALGTLTPSWEVGSPKGLLVREAKVADVGSVRVEGDRAFVIYRGIEGMVMATSMAKENGRWKVASLGGVPLS